MSEMIPFPAPFGPNDDRSQPLNAESLADRIAYLVQRERFLADIVRFNRQELLEARAELKARLAEAAAQEAQP